MPAYPRTLSLGREGSPSGSCVLFRSEIDSDSTDDLLSPSNGLKIKEHRHESSDRGVSVVCFEQTKGAFSRVPAADNVAGVHRCR